MRPQKRPDFDLLIFAKFGSTGEKFQKVPRFEGLKFRKKQTKRWCMYGCYHAR